VVARQKTIAPVQSEAQPEPVSHGRFTLRRVGQGPVEGTPSLGLKWNTVEHRKVVIRITSDPGGAIQLVPLDPGDYEAIRNKDELTQKMTDASQVDAIEIATASNRAAGRVFGVRGADMTYILRVQKSDTVVSALGTTVTLSGELKH
jgi:hypothetical protein